MAYLTLNGYLLNTGNGVSYSAGDNIDITNGVISGKDWSTEIESATSGKQDALTFDYNEADEISGINGSAFAGAGDAVTWHSLSGTMYLDNVNGRIEASTSGLAASDQLMLEETDSFDDDQTTSVFTSDAVNVIRFTIPAYGYDYSLDYEAISLDSEGNYKTFTSGHLTGNDEISEELIPPEDNTGHFMFHLYNFEDISIVTMNFELINRTYRKVELQEALEAGDGIRIAGNTISCSGTLNAEYNYAGLDHTAKELRVMSGMAGNNTLMVSDGSVSSTFALPSSTVTGLLLSRGGGIILGVTPTGSGVYGLTSGASFSEVTNNKSFTMAMQWDKSITTSTTGPAISPSAIDSAEIKHNWTSDSNFNFSYNASTNRLQIGNPNGKTVHCVATLSILPQVTEPMTGYFGSSLAASNETEKLPMTNYTKNEFYDFSTSQSNITQKQLWMCDASGNSKAIPTGTYRCELVVKGYYA